MKQNYIIALLLISCGMIAQTINFPDPNFKAQLLYGNNVVRGATGSNINVDSNGDGEIQLSEAEAVYEIFIQTVSPPITDLTGIENFINLDEFTIDHHNIPTVDLTGLHNLTEFSGSDGIINIDATGLQNLKKFSIHGNTLLSVVLFNNPLLNNLIISGTTQIPSLALSDLPNLGTLSLQSNNFSEVHLNNLPSLDTLDFNNNDLVEELDLTALPSLYNLGVVENNNLSSLNITGLSNMAFLYCDGNPNITSLDFTGLSNLWNVYCTNNSLTTIDLSDYNNVFILYLENNNLSSIDVSGSHYLAVLGCDNNPVEYINLKNGSTDNNLTAINNPNLKFVCVDENENPDILNYLSENYPDCVVNSYCSFVPGGEYYIMQGSFSYDGNSNGCDAGDNLVPLQGFSIDNGSFIDTIIANTSGNYTTGIPDGSYAFTPINPNPAYFSVSPESVSLTFPNDTEPYIQNFCIAPLGTFHDLDITLLPITPARPGFDAVYRLIYRNKGTTAQFATAFFYYNDGVLDFVAASVMPNGNNPGVVSWDFDNIQPFQEGFIDITLNVNSPVETPAVNIDDVLNFEANIQNPIPEAVEQTMEDNTYALNQIVVGSFDPNDKTCVEGTTITTDMTGDYVTYLIRFENTGTFHAENIVVKDVIDTEKFEISSLKPLQSSHDYVTRITNGNNIEFIFEGIMLPGTPSEERYGFVAFKIKTKATLQVNDTFSNTAAIYFDYNAPIITNEAITTIEVLGTEDFTFNNYINLYPNPTSSILNIELKDVITLKGLEVYNIMGQRVLEIQNADNINSIDIARLSVGTYVLKAITDKGVSHSKFIKK